MGLLSSANSQRAGREPGSTVSPADDGSEDSEERKGDRRVAATDQWQDSRCKYKVPESSEATSREGVASI